MYRTMIFLFFSFLFIISVSCNMDGYHDLAEPVNRFSQLGPQSSAFMRTDKFEDASFVELFIISNINEPLGNCVFMQVLTDSQAVRTELRIGNYKISDNQIEIRDNIGYSNVYKSTSSPSGRPGALQLDFHSKAYAQFSWTNNTEAGIIQIDDHYYRRVDLIFESILNDDNPRRAEQLMKMILLCTFTNHARIEGFGGFGMLQYIGKTTPFDGLMFGTLELSVDGLKTLKTRFLYRNHCDISGIVFNGEINNQSDMSGNGSLGGTLTFTIQGSVHTWEGRIQYSGIEISHTMPVSGTYGVCIGEETFPVSSDYGTPGKYDLTDILDPDPAGW